MALLVKELQIGDWVKIGDADKYHGYYGKVLAINSITGYCIVGVMIGEDATTQTDVFIDDIEPILLTPEILEKNGFVLNSFDRWMNEEYGIALSTRDDFYFIWDRIQINFVHEFQHAIRFVGWHELADDFQI